MTYEIDKINAVAMELGKIKGGLTVILFGSYAKENQDEDSDVDLLILFRDRRSMMSGRSMVIKMVSKSGMFIQAVSCTVDELKESPLLSPILREGKTLHSTPGFNLQNLATFKSYALIAYSLSKMKAGEKVKLVHRLYGRKRGCGVLSEAGGYKIGRSHVMAPLPSARKITSVLEEYGANYNIRYIWIPI